MKHLVVSISSPGEVLADFERVYKKVRSGKPTTPRYEISFDNQREFNRFLRNLHVLSSIRTHKPRSVYELARQSGIDVANLNKIILFFERVGAIRVKSELVSGRRVRRPIVEYDRIEFRLAG